MPGKDVRILRIMRLVLLNRAGRSLAVRKSASWTGCRMQGLVHPADSYFPKAIGRIKDKTYETTNTTLPLIYQTHLLQREMCAVILNALID
jgi:hypothetical protein